MNKRKTEEKEELAQRRKGAKAQRKNPWRLGGLARESFF